MSEDHDWYPDLHTADDIAAAREVLMTWREHTGDEDAATRMAQQITKRAVDLGLERP